MSQLSWLRTSYWVGAVADTLVGVSILIPSRMGETEFRNPMGLAATLVFGWTCLLIWADRKPFERKGVLLLTVFPVITGLVASAVYSAAVGLLPLNRIIAPCIVGGSIIILMLYSYWNARGTEP